MERQSALGWRNANAKGTEKERSRVRDRASDRVPSGGQMPTPKGQKERDQESGIELATECPRVAKCRHQRDRKRERSRVRDRATECPRVAKCQRQEQLRETAGIGCGKIASQVRYKVQ